MAGCASWKCQWAGRGEQSRRVVPPSPLPVGPIRLGKSCSLTPRASPPVAVLPAPGGPPHEPPPSPRLQYLRMGFFCCFFFTN